MTLFGIVMLFNPVHSKKDSSPIDVTFSSRVSSVNPVQLLQKPFGILVTKFFNKGDLRKVGSGNIGATNVMRVGGLRLAGLTWLFDMSKAIIAVLLGRYFVGASFGVWCGFIAIVGHCFPSC